LNPCSALGSMAPRSAPRSTASRSAPRSVAPRYRPRQHHLGCPVVHGQTPRSQDLWRRDVLPRSHESWCRTPGTKDQFTSPKEPNINFLKKRPNCKKLGPPGQKRKRQAEANLLVGCCLYINMLRTQYSRIRIWYILHIFGIFYMF
jgi:hypothetical protein